MIDFSYCVGKEKVPKKADDVGGESESAELREIPWDTRP